jgi:hypothetical protein
MKIVFFIATHDRFDRFEWTFRSVYSRRHDYIIHIDSKAGDDYVLAVKALIADKPNVTLLPRLDGVWGGFSLVNMEIHAIRAALSSGHEWDYFINLSGACLLVRQLAELEEFLSENAPKNFIDRRAIEQLPEPLRSRIKRRKRFLHIEWRGKIRRLPLYISFLRSHISHYGSQWHMLHRELCEYALGAPSLKRALIATSWIPDEFYWQNIANRAPQAYPIDADYRRYVVFGGKSNAGVLDSSHLEAIEQSGAFFARKFCPDVAPSLVVELVNRATKDSSANG